jgi:hypothetical protein
MQACSSWPAAAGPLCDMIISLKPQLSFRSIVFNAHLKDVDTPPPSVFVSKRRVLRDLQNGQQT